MMDWTARLSQAFDDGIRSLEPWDAKRANLCLWMPGSTFWSMRAGSIKRSRATRL